MSCEQPGIDQREAIAYHEAGHAVVSMKLGYKCLYITIIPDGSRLGHVCCEDPLIGEGDDKIEHALRLLLGARLAEGKHTRSRDIWGDADDRVKATNLALLATDRDTRAGRRETPERTPPPGDKEACASPQPLKD